MLRALTEDCIDRHVDHTQLATVKAAEESERAILSAFGEKLTAAGQLAVDLNAIERVHALHQLAPTFYERVVNSELTLDQAERLVRRVSRSGGNRQAAR